MKKAKTIIRDDWEDDWIEEENIYSEDARTLLVEEDELSPEEAAFMQGYNEGS